jgi:putative iron-only hydrogenase system regulator
MENTRHVGVLAIIITKREKTAPLVNKVLTKHGDLIIGRMGLPYGDRGMHIISLIVDGTKPELEAFAAAVKAVPDTIVESTMSPVCVD